MRTHVHNLARRFSRQNDRGANGESKHLFGTSADGAHRKSSPSILEKFTPSTLGVLEINFAHSVILITALGGSAFSVTR